jgi:predicted O-linked N-acetylglucosamine transferase (SPINDLY family)
VGVGMSSAVIALASLRLAPVQCVSFGHTATTMSPAIDYMILPEDFVGARECFSEQLITLPKAAMPFMPPAHSVRKPLLRRDGPIRIAVVASAMKLNARLLEVFGRISTTAKSKLEFHIFPAFAVGLVHQELARVIGRTLPNAIVYAESPRPEFYERLAGCDLFLCPFPYGNMNGIIDAISLGLPGVCLDGPEAHAHADSAHFSRAGFSPELTTKTVDEYVAAAVRLVDDSAWRAKCGRAARSCDLDRAFYKGDASLFCRAMADLVKRPAKTDAGELRERA